jgi:hypothetical protein
MQYPFRRSVGTMQKFPIWASFIRPLFGPPQQGDIAGTCGFVPMDDTRHFLLETIKSCLSGKYHAGFYWGCLVVVDFPSHGLKGFKGCDKIRSPEGNLHWPRDHDLHLRFRLLSAWRHRVFGDRIIKMEIGHVLLQLHYV